MLDAGRWTLDAGRWTLDAGRWTLDAGRWTLDAGRWTLDAGRWMVVMEMDFVKNGYRSWEGIARFSASLSIDRLVGQSVNQCLGVHEVEYIVSS